MRTGGHDRQLIPIANARCTDEAVDLEAEVGAVLRQVAAAGEATVRGGLDSPRGGHVGRVVQALPHRDSGRLRHLEVDSRRGLVGVEPQGRRGKASRCVVGRRRRTPLGRVLRHPAVVREERQLLPVRRVGSRVGTRARLDRPEPPSVDLGHVIRDESVVGIPLWRLADEVVPGRSAVAVVASAVEGKLSSHRSSSPSRSIDKYAGNQEISGNQS